MPAPTTAAELVSLVRKSRLVADDRLESYLAGSADDAPADLAKKLQDDGLLTPFQADQLLRGRHKGFVLGKYRLLERIGMGGMGQIYLAEHLSMRRRVAVKVLPPDRSTSPFARERFLREARATAAVEHPNLVRVFDVENEGEVSFLVMEYIDGVSLHDLVARRGPLDGARAAYYTAQVAAGLSGLHERSLVHRDVKPANVLLDRTGTVKVLDLGLVRSELDGDDLTRQEGAKLIGTADYLAPEQAINCSKVDSRADIYGLGATAYYLLTGIPPFAAEKLSQKLIAHQVQDVKPPHKLRPGVPVELSAVVLQMLAKQPQDRPQSAADVVTLLQPWLTTAPPLPEEADFPKQASGVATPSIAMSFAHRLNGTSLALSAVKKPGSKPAVHGLSGGSAVRFGSDFPAHPGSQAGHKTASMASEETATNHPSPIPGEVEFEIPPPSFESSGRNPSPARPDTTSAKIGALFGPSQPVIELEPAPPPGFLTRVWRWLFGSPDEGQ
jgi:serine/threonine protein kinase